MKYTDILRLNNQMEEPLSGLPPYRIIVLSNIITAQLNEILEFTLRSEGINAQVISGDYDNILQESSKYRHCNAIVIFWEAANFVEGLQYKADLMTENEIGSLLTKVTSEIDFVFSNLKDTPLVMLNRFSSLIFNHAQLYENNFDHLVKKLNRYLEQKVNDSSFYLIDVDKVISEISVSAAADFRYYYSSKALYTVNFFRTWTNYVKPGFMSVLGKAKKALLFDCDHTLWKGVVGEDGEKNIEMSAKTKNGVVFEEIQHLAADLCRKKGVIIGLCSKNNPQDIEDVISNHPDMVLTNEDIVVKKVNWNDKVTNLREIAGEMNLGLDSFVFFDDSDFEIDFVKEHLPEVEAIKVPEKIFEYPSLFRKMSRLFFRRNINSEDLNRSGMYKQDIQRQVIKNSFPDLEGYLKSLDLCLDIHKDDEQKIPRMAQLTQKTNQFNLTTKRYTDVDIRKFVEKRDDSIYCFDLADRYGDYGITGLCIVNKDPHQKIAVIDTFLMSCRIIGRNAEMAFFDFLISDLRSAGIERMESSYKRTAKNGQVSDFFDKVGFSCNANHAEEKKYILCIEDYIPQNLDYIKIKFHGTES